MNSTLLVSGGDNIKFWNINGLECVQQIKPHVGDISSITWSNDNMCIASASNSGDNIALTSSLDYRSMVIEGKEAKAKTCVTFDSQSRHLAAGGSEGIIHVWNLKRSKLINTLWQLKGPTTCLQYNYDDSLIAASSATAGLMLFNLNNNRVESLNLKDTHQAVSGIKSLQFNYINHSQLATVSNDTSTVIWDTEFLQPVYKFANVHTAPATDLAFSPLNQMFLISVGLDKAIVFYDVQSKKVITTLNTENLLTSVDIMHDGKTIAIGSSNGLIYIYDMRAFNSPISSTVAHKSTVHKIKFQKSQKINELKDDSFKDYIGRKHAAIELLEPNLKRENLKSVIEKKQNGFTNMKINKNEFIDPQICLNETSEPLRGSSQHNINSKISETRNLSTTNISNNSTNNNITFNAALAQQSFLIETASHINNGLVGIDSSNETRLLDSSESAEIKEKSRPDAQPTISVKEVNKETFILQRDMIRDIIRDEMDSYFDQIHRDVASLHNDMIIKFHSLKEEILTSIKEKSINNDLCLEIKRLRLENEELKKNF